VAAVVKAWRSKEGMWAVRVTRCWEQRWRDATGIPQLGSLQCSEQRTGTKERYQGTENGLAPSFPLPVFLMPSYSQLSSLFSSVLCGSPNLSPAANSLAEQVLHRGSFDLLRLLPEGWSPVHIECVARHQSPWKSQSFN
jgi:hypothetical protein